MNLALAGLSGALLLGGILGIGLGVRGTTRPHRRIRPSLGAPGTPRRRRNLRLLVGLALGFVVFALTGWVLALLLVPLAVIGVPYLLGNPENRDIRVLEALDRWVRTLAATMVTGHSVTDAIRTSRRNAPELLREPVNLLVSRLNDRWSTRDALQEFADRLDSPDADAVIAALSLAAHRGGTGATRTLGAIAESIQDQLRALREIEAERAKPRVVVRQVTGISAVVLIAALLTSGAYFDPYRTPFGQVLLALLIAGYAGSLLMLRRLAVPRRRDRILRGTP
ncbi:type II secretion system F family protein [Granulicoccus phenolivorans]|uniref:type II secretion system F family protein n=1 Tax=Granulicoccus phenolivorans TaxID=266854 RepID=UPI0004263C99|nr:type II secretion system F family protein [Granulicoccus phenolivorans]